MTAEEQAQLPVLSDIISDEQIDDIESLMTDFDPDGLLDVGELDGFLSGLAVGPNPSTLDRWWNTITGPNPKWADADAAERVRALIEAYYRMVQARVSVSPFELGPDSVPPLFDPLLDVEDDSVDVDDLEDDDEDDMSWLDLEDDEADVETDADDDDAEFAAVFDDDDDDDDDDDIVDVADDDINDPELAEFASDDPGDEPGVGETWLSGFRYALSLQSDDWRRVLEEEPALAPWLHQLWIAADGAQGAEHLDALPHMPPSATAPEDAGFLALESSLRTHAGSDDGGLRDPDYLIGAIPVVLHQLWRRNRAGAGAVAAQIASDIELGLANQQSALSFDLAEKLDQYAVPAGGMNLERLDGYWSAWIASGVEQSPFDQIQRVLGPNLVWEDADEARDTLMAMVSYWKLIKDRIAREANPEDERCHPWIDFGESDPAERPNHPFGKAFAEGFLEAIDELPRSAKLLLMDPEAKHWLAPIEALVSGRSLEKRNARLEFEERMACIGELPECIGHLAGFWHAADLPARATPARADSLPGRNDPCPCGSGKKYKKCHGAPERLN